MKVLLVFLINAVLVGGSQVIRTSVCAGERVNLQCSPGKVLYIQRVFWGRDDRITCADPDMMGDETTAEAVSRSRAIVNCHSVHALQTMKDLCGEKQSCAFNTKYELLGNPCVNSSVVPFLRMDYRCISERYHGLVCEDAMAARLRLACPPGKFIVPGDVFFGRRDVDTCGDWVEEAQRQDTTCVNKNALTAFTLLCTGLRTCDIGADDRLFGDPCPDTHKYLEVDYTCEECVNLWPSDLECEYWANRGDCSTNTWLSLFCVNACMKCDNKPPECVNPFGDTQCYKWRQEGQCLQNPAWMTTYCRKACTDCALNAPCINHYDAINSTACDLWHDDGECGRNVQFMFEWCTKSCLQCEENSHIKCEMKASVEDCDMHTINGQCEYNPGWMWPNCFSNCLACTSDPVCSNKLPDATCQRLKDDGECGNNPTPMLKNCFKTCIGCDSPVCVNTYGDDSMCEFWAWEGDCNNATVQQWMHNNCWKTCTRCEPYDTFPVCVNAPDVDSQCDGWASNGECYTNEEWMLMNCRKSCTLCGSDYHQMDIYGGEPLPGMENDFTEAHTYVLDTIAAGVLKSFTFFFVNTNSMHLHIWREENGLIGIVYSQHVKPKGKNYAQTIPVHRCFEVNPGTDRISFTSLRKHSPVAFNYDIDQLFKPTSVRIAANEVNFSYLGMPFKWSFSAEVDEGAHCN